MTDKARELLERVLTGIDRYGDIYPETLEEIRAYLAEPEQEDEPTKAEVAVYLFAAWLTCQPGVMEIGASCDASPMAQAIDQYFKEHPERMFEAKLHPAPRKPFVRLSDDEIIEAYKNTPIKSALAYFIAGVRLAESKYNGEKQ